ncbi:MAG: hypothetical protein ACLF0G_11790 [Candidatus Brocadiia bacterium]
MSRALVAAVLVALAGAEAGTVKVVLEDYESPAEPRLGGAAVHRQSRLRTSEADPFQGTRCAQLRYRFTAREGLQYLEASSPHRVAGVPVRLSVAVRGDGSGQMVRARFADASGEVHQFDLGRLDFAGWRVLSADLTGPRGTWGGDGNGRLDGPSRFLSLVLDALVRPGHGTVAFDAIALEAEGSPEDFMEARFEPAQPHGYFWGPDQRPAGSLVVTAGTAEPVEATVEARLLDRRGETVAELGGQRVEVRHGETARLEPSLAIPRYGVYFVEVGTGEGASRHSLCWLPARAPLWPDGPFGVCTHFGQRKHAVPLTHQLIRAMGAAWIRDEISWGASERQKGKLAFQDHHDRYMRVAAEAGLRPLIIFDYGNRLYDEGMAPISPEAVEAFVRYCRALMDHYRPICRHWEIWNEPNIHFWKPEPNVADYTRLMKAVYQACKEADPEATFVGVCTAGTNLKFIQGVLERGGAEAMDAISVHPYRYPRSPEESDFVDEMRRLEALLERHDAGHLPVWLTEFGYPTHTGKRGLPEHTAAAYLARLMLHALSLPFIERLFVYDFQNDGTNPEYNEHNFGLVRLDHSPKVGYAAYCTLARMLHRRRFQRAVEAGEGVVAYEFDGPDGPVLAAWAPGEAATLALRSSAREVAVTDLMGNTRPVEPTDGRLELRLGEEPLFLTGHGEVAPAEQPTP